MTKDLTTVSHHIFLVEDDAALSKALRKKLVEFPKICVLATQFLLCQKKFSTLRKIFSRDSKKYVFRCKV